MLTNCVLILKGGKNITDALDDTVVASNGQVNNFARIAEHEMEDYISSIQLAPDSKVQYIYPLEGNEAGLIDLLADKKAWGNSKIQY